VFFEDIHERLVCRHIPREACSAVRAMCVNVTCQCTCTSASAYMNRRGTLNKTNTKSVPLMVIVGLHSPYSVLRGTLEANETVIKLLASHGKGLDCVMFCFV